MYIVRVLCTMYLYSSLYHIVVAQELQIAVRTDTETRIPSKVITVGDEIPRMHCAKFELRRGVLHRASYARN